MCEATGILAAAFPVSASTCCLVQRFPGSTQLSVTTTRAPTYYSYLTMPRLRELGKNRGIVEIIVVKKIPKPNPSTACSVRHAKTNPQVEGISLVNL